MTEQEIIDNIRVLLGNIDPEDLPDAVIKMFLQKWEYSLDIAKHPDRMPLVIYNTVVDCVRWLIVQEVSSGNASVTERLEKIGDETISVKGGSTWTTWKDFLDWLLENPEYVDPSLAFNSSLVIIGGVRKDQVYNVKDNPNSFNGYMEQGVYPIRDIPTESSSNRLRRSPWTR